ncbi:EF-P 5-aminopentanol modification-associated protein YfmF [Thermovenabulum gondwanense]|uniref:Putative zinc protease n=1 Tax=Thermovenabulum gondwanense TaxID=520767 RepID=A0A162MLT3_9FIRM|nr:pitrilysin family protein [Thermovenabulum gondwanense]KYO66670.1 putative zinc protease [Thermovenabulum gondwanense]
MERFIKKRLDNGLNVYLYPTRKFKTLTFSLFIHRNLEKENATKNALLPFVLKRGTKSLPTARKLSRYLESLYGADLGADVVKKGERQIIQILLDVVNPDYLGQNGDFLDKCLEIFREMILDPYIEEGSFKKEYVDQEKDVLKRIIESLFNDKYNYAIERCLQEMCKDEPYSIYKYGSIDDLAGINEKNLYEYYLETIKTSPMDVFAVGDFDAETIWEKLNSLFKFQRSEIPLKPVSVKKEILEERFVEEKQDVNQGKLSIGLRTNVKYGDEDFYALLVLNSILGGGPYSKLFQNVREKASLAYYAFSRLEKSKGIMLISSGIDFENLDKAVDIIKIQLEDIKKGNITDYEYESSLKDLINSLKQAKDSAPSIISLFLDGVINGIEENIDDYIDKITKVTKDDVVRVAQNIKLDTIYFLNKKD